jgi:hypothetical protein
MRKEMHKVIVIITREIAAAFFILGNGKVRWTVLARRGGSGKGFVGDWRVELRAVNRRSRMAY